MMINAVNQRVESGRRSAEKHSKVELLEADNLSTAQINEWRALAAVSGVPNPFYHPDFQIPLWKHLTPRRPPCLLTVRDNHQGQLTGLAIVERRRATKRLPFPQLLGFRNKYVFLEEMLLRKEDEQQTLTAILLWLNQSNYRHGLRLGASYEAAQEDSPWTVPLANCRKYRERTWSRAALNCRDFRIDHHLQRNCSKSRRKSLRRSRRKLEETGTVAFRIRYGAAINHEVIETFLRLERHSWKGEQGTAIACQDDHRKFFVEMVQRMSAENLLLFGELTVDGQVVASSCNLISGNRLFAFKIGWHPDFASGSPGVWAELELADAVARNLPEIDLIDSCSSAGSHLESIWTDQIVCERFCYSTSRRARAVLQMVEFARFLKGRRRLS